MNNRDMPLSRGSEHEVPGTAIVEDLLNSLPEWRSVQDIVRLSIKALTDLAKFQNSSIKELEYSQSDFAMKSEVASALAMKANLADLSRAISETRSSLDNKVNYDEIRSFLDDRVTRNDLLHLLQGKVSVEEFRTAIEFKVDIKEMQNEFRSLRNSFEELKMQVSTSLQQCITAREFSALQRIVEGKAEIGEMNAALNEKATKTSVANAMHKKANKADVEEMLAEKANVSLVNGLSSAIESKVGVASFNMLAAEVDKKAETVHVERLLSVELGKKSDQTDLESLYSAVNSLKKEFEIKLQQQSILLGNYINDLKSETEMQKLALTNAMEKKAEFRDVEKLSEMVLKKSDTEELNYLVLSTKNEISNLVQGHQSAIKQDMKRLENAVLEQLGFLDSKMRSFEGDQGSIKDLLKTTNERHRVEIEELAKSMDKAKTEDARALRYDIDKIQRELDDNKRGKYEESKSRQSIQELKAIREELDFKYDQLESKLKDMSISTKEILMRNEREVEAITGNIKARTEDLQYVQNCIEDFKSSSIKKHDWEIQALKLQEEIEKLGKDVLLKASIKDICTLLDIKANIDDVNHALEDLHGELDTKISVDELADKLKEQSCINDALCSENCVARWLWKSGELKTGCIPWEIQTINTCPENFIWEKDKTTILSLSPGLYFVMFGVFSRRKAVVQLLVNGEIVISEGNMGGKILGKHSSGNVVGCTCAEFLSLPARARISVTYSGESCEGFLGLKKL